MNHHRSAIVCGGRDYDDYEFLHKILKEIDPSIVIQGGAKGADRLAKLFCIKEGKHYAEVPAMWNTYGKGAGHKRNYAMTYLNPGCVIAFNGGRGTDMMVKIAHELGIHVYDYREALA